MTFKPVCDLCKTADPVRRLAAAGQFMVFSVENHQSCFNILYCQRLHHLYAFGKRAAVVFITVYEQRRCSHFVRAAKRGVFPECRCIGISEQTGRTALIRSEVRTDITDQGHGDHSGRNTGAGG